MGAFFTSSCVNLVRVAVLSPSSLLYILRSWNKQWVSFKHLLSQLQFNLPNSVSNSLLRDCESFFLETLTFFFLEKVGNRQKTESSSLLLSGSHCSRALSPLT